MKSKKILIIVPLVLVLTLIFVFNIPYIKFKIMINEQKALGKEYEKQATQMIDKYLEENSIDGEISNLYCQFDEWSCTNIVNANLTADGNNFYISVDVAEGTIYCNYMESELINNLKNYIIDRLKANNFDIPEDIELHTNVHSSYIYDDFATEDGIKTMEDILNSDKYHLCITLKYIDNQNIDFQNADMSFMFDDKLSDIWVNLVNFKNQENYTFEDIATKLYYNKDYFSMLSDSLKEYNHFETEYVQGTYQNLHSIEYVNYDNPT